MVLGEIFGGIFGIALFIFIIILIIVWTIFPFYIIAIYKRLRNIEEMLSEHYKKKK